MSLLAELPPDKRVRWSDERVTWITQLVSDGFSATEIAKQMGITRNAALGKIHRLKLELKWKGTPGKYERLKNGRQHRFQNPATQRRKAIAKQLLELPLPVCDPVGFWELESHHCRWILNETGETPRLEDTLYCGAKAALGTSWCPRHYRMVYRIEASAEARNVAA